MRHSPTSWFYLLLFCLLADATFGRAQTTTHDVTPPARIDATAGNRQLGTPTVPKPTQIGWNELVRQLRDAMASWERVRAQRIPVIDIANSRADDPPRKALTTRYKALFAKRRSNRRWYRYWQNEERLSAQVSRLYEKLAALLRRQLIALRTQQKRAGVELAQRVTNSSTALSERTSTLDEIRKRVTKLEAEQQEKKATLKTLPPEERKLKRAETLARKQFERLQKGDDKEAQKKSADELKKATEALQRLTTRMTTLKTEIKALELAVSSCRAWGEKRTLPSKTIEDKACRQSAERWLALGTRLSTLAADQKALETGIASRKAEIESKSATAALLDVRRHSLARWSKLAHDKTVNQDKYLEAISQDIKAVRRRLNSLALQQSRQATKPSPKKRSSTKVNGRSPYAEYKAELSQILSDKARLEERRKEVRANHELVTAQLASMNILSKAQSTDLSLFEREVSIISEELRRIENAPLERRAAKLPLVRDWSWLAIWRHYEAKANGKRDKLTGALRDTQSSIDSLHSDASVFQFESKDLARSIAIAQRKASNLANQRNRYLWRTALYWLRANAWQIPLFLLGAWILLWITRRIGDSMVERAKTRRKFIEDRDAMQQLETLVKVTRGVARLVIYLAALLGIVASLGVNISPILGAGAIFGLAISFGSQNLVRDVVTGFFILLENQYAVGDVVTIGGVTGGVEQITLRRTVVRGLDGTLHNIPNGSVSLVSNKTQGWSRALIHVGVGYESDLALVEEVANRVGTSLWDDEKWRWQLLEEAPKYIGLTELGDSALVVRVMGKTITGQQWDVERELMKRLKEAFDEAGINIPFPQRDLHLKLVPEAKILEIAKPPKEKA